SEPLEPGDMVGVETLGGRAGQLLEFRGDEAVVVVGAMKLSVPRGALRRSGRRGPETGAAVAIAGDVPDVDARTEIDLRGMRADEAAGVLTQALDSVVRADLKVLRIIHGKGTGALRERVAEMLRGDSRVKTFRLGAWNEGGAGVTVVALE
ncbi:MAG: Smr/MutS family protein, partial [Gemmatimonadaceae bacterium]